MVPENVSLKGKGYSKEFPEWDWPVSYQVVGRVIAYQANDG